MMKTSIFYNLWGRKILLSPSCKVFGAIFFADYFGTDLLVIIFFNSDTNIDYFFILIQTSIFKACVLSKAVREFVSYLPHTAAGHNTEGCVAIPPVDILVPWSLGTARTFSLYLWATDRTASSRTNMPKSWNHCNIIWTIN